MMNEALSYIVGHVALEGDGLIPDGAFAWDSFGFSLRARNANNHQTTWLVLGSGLYALMDYMAKYGGGTAKFGVYDGKNLVGEGWVE